MVNTGLTVSLFDFQEQAVLKLLDLTSKPGGKQTIVMKAPTGSGKTIILIDYIDKYLTNVNSNTAIRDSERKNLFDRIAEAHRGGMRFIVIIDEEHSNNTAKARTVIDSFAAKNIIRVSTTASENKRYEFFEIDEVDVIGAGLITKALYVNEGITDNLEVTDDYDHLLDLADAKRRAIASRYRSIHKNIRPLVLIQFPNGQPETISAVEQKLETMGYSYDNGMVSKWMSGDKKNLPDNLTENDGVPVFLLMKQAISTGWDCPRAKILVKLREGMSESFEIQTIGRIRRMPEAKHDQENSFVKKIETDHRENLS